MPTLGPTASTPPPSHKTVRRRLSSAPTVLVVDDDIETLEALQDGLRHAGYLTAVALGADDALALLGSGLRPSLILVDLMMPRVDGWRLIAKIRELGFAGTPIVSMTGGDSVGRTPASWAHLQKPVSLEELMSVVGRLSGGSTRRSHGAGE